VPDPASIQTLLVLVAIAVASLAVPYATAAAIRNATLAHDLKVKVARLRVEYLRRLKRAEEEAEIVVDPVPDQSEDAPRAAA
jgi:hypothetical protein